MQKADGGHARRDFAFEKQSWAQCWRGLRTTGCAAATLGLPNVNKICSHSSFQSRGDLPTGKSLMRDSNSKSLVCHIQIECSCAFLVPLKHALAANSSCRDQGERTNCEPEVTNRSSPSKDHAMRKVLALTASQMKPEGPAQSHSYHSGTSVRRLGRHG